MSGISSIENQNFTKMNFKLIFTALLLAFYTIALSQSKNTLPIITEEDFQTPQTDWLIDDSPYVAKVSKSEDGKSYFLHNGLISREIRLVPNANTVAFENLMTTESVIRGVKPEGEITIDSTQYNIGGLVGQPNYAFLKEAWIPHLKKAPNSLEINEITIDSIKPHLNWMSKRHAQNKVWPPKGVHLKMDYLLPTDKNIIVSVHYELYDHIPVLCKWISVENNGEKAVTVNHFVSEILAAVEYSSRVEDRGAPFETPNIHVETDYAFGGMTVANSNRKSVHWEKDPDYSSQVNYLKNTPCLLKTYPELGPEQTLEPGGLFESFRTYIMPFDSYDRERNGLAKRRMYRTLAPWTTENPLMMHVRMADWESVKRGIDQCAEVGFEMIILTFGSGFNMEDDSPEYLAQMKKYADYAKSKGIEIGGYSLLASRSIDEQNDVVMPEGKKATFGNSPCLESDWGQKYFDKLHHFFEQTGFTLLEHDGNYPGDECLSENHPGHKNVHDSRWNQWRKITDFYRWCRSKGIYLNVPDYYYMSGSNKCGMGYREVNWSLPREEQIIHTRQNIYDGTWDKLNSMGWMFVPLTEYHGGGAAATIEPLDEHKSHYEKMLVSNLGAGVQACYRGPRLYDTESTKDLVSKWTSWYKEHREVLEGDLIHLRRADGRDLDYWLLVNPKAEEKGLLMVFNPLDKDIQKNIRVPLYYTGIQEKVLFNINDEKINKTELDRHYELNIEVNVPKNGFSWVVFKNFKKK
jgi:hypothetical protein